MSLASLTPLERKLTRLGLASGEQTDVLDSVAALRRVSAGEMVVGLGDVSSHVVALLDGLGARYKLGVQGERQILAFVIPGDFCNAASGASGVMDHGVVAVTACTLAMIPLPAFRAMVSGSPRLAMTFWRDTSAEAAVEREWLFNLGRRNATCRLAHLLCEVHVRLQRADLATASRFPFPVTQNDLADATGLSTVHVNRSLQALRRMGLITFARGEVAVLNRDALRSLAGFDDAYLGAETGDADVAAETGRRGSGAAVAHA